jgi:hypothetical protein
VVKFCILFVSLFKYVSYLGFDSYWQKIYGEYEYTYSDIVSYLRNYLPAAKQDSYKMYGSDQEGLIDSWCSFTGGHGYENIEIKSPELKLKVTDKITIKIE